MTEKHLPSGANHAGKALGEKKLPLCKLAFVLVMIHGGKKVARDVTQFHYPPEVLGDVRASGIPDHVGDQGVAKAWPRRGQGVAKAWPRQGIVNVHCVPFFSTAGPG